MRFYVLFPPPFFFPQKPVLFSNIHKTVNFEKVWFFSMTANGINALFGIKTEFEMPKSGAWQAIECNTWPISLFLSRFWCFPKPLPCNNAAVNGLCNQPYWQVKKSSFWVSEGQKHTWCISTSTIGNYQNNLILRCENVIFLVVFWEL